MKFLLSNHFNRLLAIGLACIPACIGTFAFLNNISGWEETIERMVHPMINMSGTFGNPAQTWRAIDSLLFTNSVYFFVTSIELVFGLIAVVGIVYMVKHFKSTEQDFSNGVVIAQRACMLGTIVYGLLFFAVGGDWFLAWQNKNLTGLQHDAVNYSLVITLAYLMLDRQAKSA